MDVTFIHADDTLAEIGVLNDIMEADIEICTRLDAAVVDNSFSFIMPEVKNSFPGNSIFSGSTYVS